MLSTTFWHRFVVLTTRRVALAVAFLWIADTVRADWPTYLHDSGRSGATAERLELPLREVWRYTTRHPPSPAWPPPARQDFWNRKSDLPPRVTYDRSFQVVSDGERVYFGSSTDDQIRALDLATGERSWTFFADGPVRLAPVVDGGRLYFGSDDGAVYCLAAVDGTLLWRRLLNPASRHIPGNGRLISLHPVRSGLIVADGKVRCASGLFPLQGTFQHLLNATDGAELARGEIDFSPQGYLRMVAGRLVSPQGRAKPRFLTSEGTPAESQPTAGTADQRVLAQVRADDLEIVGSDGRVTALSSEQELIWSHDVAGKAYSLAVAGGGLLVSTDRGVVHYFSHEARETGEQRKELADVESLPGISADAEQLLKAVEAVGIDRGYALVAGRSTPEVAGKLALRSQMRLVGIVDGASLAKGREQLAEAGLYGRVALKSRWEPFASAVFNLILLSESTEFAPNVERLLVPGNGVLLQACSNEEACQRQMRQWAARLPGDTYTVERWNTCVCIRRQTAIGTGQWTHMYGAPDNRACSDDELVGNELALQWFGRPGPRDMLDRHHRTVPPLFVAGRLFVPGNDRIFAVDGYNGSPLWEADLANFRRVAVMRDSGSMAAASDYLYAVAKDRCYGLNALTGSFDLNFSVPRQAEPRDWGYVAYVGDRLIGSTTQAGAARGDHTRRQIYEAYFDSVPVVTSDGIFCRDRHDGKLLWHHRLTGGAILNPTITVADGRVYFVETADAPSEDADAISEEPGRVFLKSALRVGSHLTALDLATGRVAWRKDVDLCAVEHHLYLCHAAGKLIAVGSKNKRQGNTLNLWYDLVAFDAEDGSLAWRATQNQRQKPNGSHGEQDHHPVVAGDVIYQEPYAYDLATGKRRSDWNLLRGGHGCGTVSASANTCFFRAGNPSLRDLQTGEQKRVTSVSRPGCWINIIPAGGLLLIPEASSGCTCDFPIQSSMAFMSQSLAQ